MKLKYIILSLLVLNLLSLSISTRLRASSKTQNEKSLMEDANDFDLPGLTSLPGLPEISLKRSAGLADGQSISFTPNLNLSSLIPEYKFYIQNQIMNQISKKNEMDFTSIEHIKAFSLNYDNIRVMIPYDNTLKIGDGYNYNQKEAKGSPYTLGPLLSEEPHSYEGQDGTVTISICTNSKQMSESFGVSAKGGIAKTTSGTLGGSYNSEYSMTEEEVVLIASHKIDLGKMIVKPNKFMMSSANRKTLATNREQFNEEFGTHFLAGYNKQCSMDVFLRKKGVSTEKKASIAAELEIEFRKVNKMGKIMKSIEDYAKSKNIKGIWKYVKTNGVLKALDFLNVNSSETDDIANFKANFKMEDYSKTFNQNITTTIKYLGSNNDQLSVDVNIVQLAIAVLEFPKHCTGDIGQYILWPYENVQDFVETKYQVDLALKIKETERLKALTKKEQDDAADIKKKVKKDEEFVEKKKIEQYKTFSNSINLLNDLYNQAILESTIIRVGLENELVPKEKQALQENDIWNLKILEIKLYDSLKKYTSLLKLSQTEQKHLSEQITLIESAKSEIEKYEKTYFKFIKCKDSNCDQCFRYSVDQCKVCKGNTVLLNGQCVAQCTEGYFKKLAQDQISYVCQKCYPGCKTCDVNAKNCLNCDTTSTDFKYLQDNKCQSSCNPGYQPSKNTGKTCMICPPNSGCTNFYSNSCKCKGSVCQGGFNYKQETEQCQTSCGAKEFYDQSTSKCLGCDKSCASCEESAGKCTSCPNKKVLSSNSCLDKCGEGFFKSSLGECQPCQAKCKTSTKNTCKCNTCNDDQYLLDNLCQNCSSNAEMFEIVKGVCQLKKAVTKKWVYEDAGDQKPCDKSGVLIASCSSGNSNPQQTNSYYSLSKCQDGSSNSENKYNHAEVCTQDPQIAEQHLSLEELPSDNGILKTCTQGAIMSMCRAGSSFGWWDDQCNFANDEHRMTIKCNKNFPVDTSDCKEIGGKHGIYLTCPNDFVLVGACNSFTNVAECTSNSIKYENVVKCCRIASKSKNGNQKKEDKKLFYYWKD